MAARIAEIENGPGKEGDKQRLIDAEKRLKEARDGNQGVSGYMKQLQSELMDTEAQIVRMSQVVEAELGQAMSNALIGLIDGTKTAEEAFAEMFANIGRAFIDMATEMIAKGFGDEGAGNTHRCQPAPAAAQPPIKRPESGVARAIRTTAEVVTRATHHAQAASMARAVLLQCYTPAKLSSTTAQQWASGTVAEKPTKAQVQDRSKSATTARR